MQLTAEALTQQLELADALLAGRDRMLEPQDLPGRYGRVVRAIDQIPHPKMMGAVRGMLKYIMLPSLIELKLAAGRLRDEADVVELARENRDRVDEVRWHLHAVHPQYAARFDELLTQLDDAAGG